MKDSTANGALTRLLEIKNSRIRALEQELKQLRKLASVAHLPLDINRIDKIREWCNAGATPFNSDIKFLLEQIDIARARNNTLERVFEDGFPENTNE